MGLYLCFVGGGGLFIKIEFLEVKYMYTHIYIYIYIYGSHDLYFFHLSLSLSLSLYYTLSICLLSLFLSVRPISLTLCKFLSVSPISCLIICISINLSKCAGMFSSHPCSFYGLLTEKMLPSNDN